MKLIYTSLVLVVSALFLACSSNAKTESKNEPKEVQKIIFETDMGNDIDDALALDMIYKYIEADKVDLLAIMTNRDDKHSSEFIDIMGTWYGYPNTPIGIVRDGANAETGKIKYDQAVCELQKDNKPLFERTLNDHELLPDAHILYREVLSKQADHSVTIISVGFSTNIARLLDTPADQYSPLTGKELVAKKVKLLSVMAGSFGEKARAEYNVVKDIASAQKVYAEWPTPIVTSPFEVGAKIHYPGESIENDFGWAELHPMVEAYKAYNTMPYNRPTWDLTSVLCVAEADSSFMHISAKGTIRVDDEGYTIFEENKAGNHTYYTVDKEQITTIKKYFVDLIIQQPAKYKVSSEH